MKKFQVLLTAAMLVAGLCGAASADCCGGACAPQKGLRSGWFTGAGTVAANSASCCKDKADAKAGSCCSSKADAKAGACCKDKADAKAGCDCGGAQKETCQCGGAKAASCKCKG